MNTWWLHICMWYKKITTINWVTICHHTELQFFFLCWEFSRFTLMATKIAVTINDHWLLLVPLKFKIIIFLWKCYLTSLQGLNLTLSIVLVNMENFNNISFPNLWKQNIFPFSFAFNFFSRAQWLVWDHIYLLIDMYVVAHWYLLMNQSIL